MAILRTKETLSAYNLRFTILTAARSDQSRGAAWSEIDIENRVWTIPGARMKTGLPHRVPLCDEAITILGKMLEWRKDNNELVFLGGRGGLLSDVAVNKTLHAILPDVTVHGFRTSFRTWGAEKTKFPSEALELALAHVNNDKVESAYQRSDLIDIRVEVMAAWCKYCKNARISA
jgi:integrase